MRVRDHVALSTAAGLAVLPFRRGRGLGVAWAASILVDVDHYLWFAARTRRVNPRAAVRYFGGAHPVQGAATHALHSPGAVVAALVLGSRRRAVLPVALGMAAHVVLDIRHELRIRAARDAALVRDAFTCQECGVRGGQVETHVWRQPWLWPSYCPDDMVSLCPECHEAAHTWARADGLAPGESVSVGTDDLSRHGRQPR
jgi:hypothetical protein